MHPLDMEVLHAPTPPAQGRGERVNPTLQARLGKELRWRGLARVAAGNGYLPEFLADCNARLVVPREGSEAQRPRLPPEDLARSLTVQALRPLSKNLPLNDQTGIYHIQTARPSDARRQAPVVVREDRLGGVTLEYQGKPLAYTGYREQAKPGEVTSSKQLTAAVDRLTASRTQQRQVDVPPPEHPWRRFPVSHKSQPAALDSPG